MRGRPVYSPGRSSCTSDASSARASASRPFSTTGGPCAGRTSSIGSSIRGGAADAGGGHVLHQPVVRTEPHAVVAPVDQIAREQCPVFLQPAAPRGGRPRRGRRRRRKRVAGPERVRRLDLLEPLDPPLVGPDGPAVVGARGSPPSCARGKRRSAGSAAHSVLSDVRVERGPEPVPVVMRNERIDQHELVPAGSHVGVAGDDPDPTPRPVPSPTPGGAPASATGRGLSS